MTSNKVCRVCGVELTDENWSPSQRKGGRYICKECAKEYARLYHEANRDEINVKNRLYNEVNRDKISVRLRLYREENRDELNANSRLYREENRDELNANRRLDRKNNPEKYKEIDIRASRKKGQLPMSDNKECPAYIGVYVNEGLIKLYFDDVEVMPYGHPGYDIICKNGKKIDAKGSTTGDKGYWSFHINHNTIADYFFCVAYDNREDKNIIHIWILPGEIFNCFTGVRISKSTLSKWAEYEHPLDKAISCCDSMRTS